MHSTREIVMPLCKFPKNFFSSSILAPSKSIPKSDPPRSLLANALRTMGPGERAVIAAKDGARFRLDPMAVKPGSIAWMPWAGVIKVTHRDHHKGASDGVEVLGAEEGERPGRRAWNHPVVVLKRKGERVWVIAVTSFRGRSLVKKFEKYGEKAMGRILREVVPIWPCDDHPFAKKNKEYKGLRLESGSRMNKTGYVKLGIVYAMDWRDLQRFDRNGKREFCLDDASVQRLLKLFKKVNPKIHRLMEGGKSGDAEQKVGRSRVDEVKAC